MIRRGEPWAVPAVGEPDRWARGDDGDLAEAVADAPPGALVGFWPETETDLAKALGISGIPPEQALEAPLDVLRVGNGRTAVNAVVLGWGPHEAGWWQRLVPMEVVVDGRTIFEGRATGVVVANGPFVWGRDVVPGAHPGDARMEVEVCAVRRRERREMRRRTVTGSHMPHPAITLRRGRHVVVRAARLMPLELDRRPWGYTEELEVELVPSAVRLYLGG